MVFIGVIKVIVCFFVFLVTNCKLRWKHLWDYVNRDNRTKNKPTRSKSNLRKNLNCHSTLPKVRLHQPKTPFMYAMDVNTVGHHWKWGIMIRKAMHLYGWRHGWKTILVSLTNRCTFTFFIFHSKTNRIIKVLLSYKIKDNRSYFLLSNF